ncbi:dihydroorotate dehydrogenase electron transfer subunit [Bacillus piscicola]|uniref:dihydroorotate dehydrogenase electron transfer subunit n=1 Tax=Bacillus piscicola TaxID=1632684 RepID=UPI001F0917A1|nr:dihydroorotate dehydrogenase electron transfer subunit [Bacillus piscicola]
MKKNNMTIYSNKKIANSIFEMVLEGEIVYDIERPGQFVHIKTADESPFLLRRPLSICDADKKAGRMTVIYRAGGAGTRLFAEKKAGLSLDVLGPLGNGFAINGTEVGKRAVLVGGGVGVPPLYGLAKALTTKGINVVTVLGFNDADTIFYEEKFKELGDVYTCTVDGSAGYKGMVTDVMKREHIDCDWLYACGPKPMLRALECQYPEAKGSLSLEERMGCGIGACLACVCHLQEDPSGREYRKVCSDGPVFPWREIAL